MTVESATYISGLNASNPPGTDPKSEGDNHLRLIKSVLKTTFPNINGAVTSSDEELNLLDGVTATTAELNILDGVTASAAELNILDGVTASTAELNILDGVTASAAELNILDGVTVTAAELNVLAGIPATLTATELGYVDGVTSSIQSQLDTLAGGGVTLTFGIQFNLDLGTDATYTLDQYATFAYTINSAVYQTASGTITAAVKIDGTNVTGLSALSITGTEGGPTSASGANAVAAGNTVSVALSSNSGAQQVSLKLNCTRG